MSESHYIFAKEVSAIDDLIENISTYFAQPEFSGALGAFFGYLAYFSRFMLPIAALAIMSRCIRSMLSQSYEPEVWAYLDLPRGERVPIRHWECTIGSAASSDVIVRGSDVSKTHSVLIRDERGNWRVYGAESGAVTGVNGEVIPADEGAAIADGNTLNIGKSNLRFFNLTEAERGIIAERRTAPGKIIAPAAMFSYVAIFQIIVCFQQFYYALPKNRGAITLAFTAIFTIMWLYFIIMRAMGRTGFEVEAIAFFLSTIGLSVCASSTPENMLKQVSLLIAGLMVFCALGWWLRDLKRVKKLIKPAAAAAILLLMMTLVAGTEYFGAKNWVSIAGISFQPSEFVKIAYIYAGTATVDRLYRGQNLIMYIGFSAVCVGALALMGDFGTALVFFATFLVISFMRSGSIGTVVLAVTGAGLAGFLALSVKPHIAQRFANWGHVWEDVNGGGFQQTRAMAASASGGLFGVGSGNGWLHSIIAADTDLVFAMVSEEMGFLIAVLAVVGIIALALFTFKNAAQGRSSFYVIAGCAAISMLMVQLGLNVFGSLDILPFTGVTFPFVSLGGSSLISCWGLLAFIKATDTRKNASFTTQDGARMRDRNEFTQIIRNTPYNQQQEQENEEYDYNGNNDSIDSPFIIEDGDESDNKRLTIKSQARNCG